MASRWRRNRRHASPHNDRVYRRPATTGLAGPRIAAAPSGNTGRSGRDSGRVLAILDPGIEQAVDDVGDEVEDDHEDGVEECDRHHDRGVAVLDRRDQQRPDPWHPEDLL